MIKTSKSCDLNFANSGRDTEAKTSPRHLNFLKQLNKTTEMCYPYISGFKIHQGTQWVPRNTVTKQINRITIRNLGIASGPTFPRRGHRRRTNLLDFHPYSHETSIFTLGALHEEVQGRQTKLHPGFFAFFTKIKKWHLRKKDYQKGPQHACYTYLFKHLLQQLWN